MSNHKRASRSSGSHRTSPARPASQALPVLLMTAAALLILAQTACGGLDLRQITPSISDDPPPGQDPVATAVSGYPPAATAPLPDLETPVLMCTPPACGPGETYDCPTGDCPGGCGTVCVAATPVSDPGAPTPLGPAPTGWESLEDWLATMWRDNANPAAVRAALLQSGMQKGLGDWGAADFDGDLRDEWVLTLYDPSMPGTVFGAAGDLWVVNGEGAIFRYYTAPSSDIYEFLAPAIITLADMTGDGLPELITNAPVCGAHTCYDYYRIIGFREGRLADLQFVAQPDGEAASGPAPISMSYSDTRLQDFDGDGLPEFMVHGGTIGSAGAGIVRPRAEVWGWDGSAVVLAETILDPTDYRHHILYEANDLMAAGDLDGALALYEATINDGSLRDEGFVHSPEQTRADIAAFSAFRLILIDLLQGNAGRASGRLAWLGTNYPDSAAARAAPALVNDWTGPENAGALCERIENSLSTWDNPTGALADMGYGNPSLAASDFCP